MRLKGRIELEGSLIAALQENKSLRDGLQSFEDEVQLMVHAKNQTFTRTVQLRDQLEMKSEEAEQLKTQAERATQREVELIAANQKLALENKQLWLKLADSLRYQAEVVGPVTQELNQIQIVNSPSQESHQTVDGVVHSPMKKVVQIENKKEEFNKNKKNRKKKKQTRKRGGHGSKKRASFTPQSDIGSSDSGLEMTQFIRDDDKLQS